MIVLIVFFILFKPVFPLLDYAINYDYISTELCENRDKPILKCNGKCQLAKELAKMSENEKPISTDKKSLSKIEIDNLLLFEVVSDYIFLYQFEFPLNKNTFYQDFYNHDVKYIPFRPPALIS